MYIPSTAFRLFGAANTLGFLHVSETLDHIDSPGKDRVQKHPQKS